MKYLCQINHPLIFDKCYYFKLAIFLDTWETMANMPYERDYSGCTVLSNSDNVILSGCYHCESR